MLYFAQSYDAQTPMKKRGFTLTELAIAFGVIGLVLGAVWGAASKAFAAQKVTHAVQEVISLAYNVRALYGGDTAVDTGNLTQSFINAKLYPAEMLNNSSCSGYSNDAGGETPCPLDPWNGEMSIGGPGQWGCPSGSCAPNSFNIVLWGMTNAQCVPFLSAMVAQAASNKLIAIFSSTVNLALTLSPTTQLSDPAISTCNGNVILQFKL
jgi:type II secretory pathway pseudopilin PulG